MENLKKAKENISRDERITRKLIDDENIKFELQSGVYLEVKKKALELKKGDIISDRDVGVEMKVSYIRRSITKIKKDCPQASIHFEVIDHRTQQTTKCVQHLYHTNQTLHLQGGKRLNRNTTTSLVADVFEKQWSKLMKDNREVIAKNTEAIAKMDMNRFAEELEEKKTKIRKKQI